MEYWSDGVAWVSFPDLCPEGAAQLSPGLPLGEECALKGRQKRPGLGFALFRPPSPLFPASPLQRYSESG